MKTASVLLAASVLAATACAKNEKAPSARPVAVGATDPAAAESTAVPDTTRDSAAAVPDVVAPAAPPAEPIDRTPACTHEEYPVAPGALEPGVLLDSSIVPAGGTPSGFRVRQDGRVELRQADGSWLAGKTLSGREMEEVRRAILEAHVDRVAGVHRLTEPLPGVAQKRLLVRQGEDVVGVFTDEPCFLPEVHTLLLPLVEMFD